jgi:hypothetical protein
MPKTLRDLRAWVNEKDERGYLMSDDFVVGVTGTCIYAHNPDCLPDGARFETTTDEEESA